jgi:acetylornithine deacetylase/succinyl-diaminopimelate desuccinylase-like protein
MNDVEGYLAANFDAHVEELKAFCRIPSVGADPAFMDVIDGAARFVADRLRRAGLESVEIVATDRNPIVTANWLHAPDAPTIVVYGHYDVQPPDPLEKWTTPPFEPEIRDGRLYARGASDDKGPVLIPILAAEAFLRLRGALPVNLKFLIEGEEEVGSPSFQGTVSRLKHQFACDVVVSADGATWRADMPSVTVASRGMLALDIVVSGAGKDLHSGRHGGSAPNPVRALAGLLASLHDRDGRVAVAGFYDGTPPPDPAIIETIRAVSFDAGQYFDEIGAPRPGPLPKGAELLTRQWIEPTLEFNGISGGYSGPGTKTVIPASASVKISCRLIAGQDPDRLAAALSQHCQERLPSGYALEITRHGRGTPAFALDMDVPALRHVEAILEELYGKPPLRVAMGATVPIGTVFRNELGVPTVFFSFSTSDEDYHAPNEFFRLSSFRDGLFAWARFYQRLGLQLPGAAQGLIPHDFFKRELNA